MIEFDLNTNDTEALLRHCESFVPTSMRAGYKPPWKSSPKHWSNTWEVARTLEPFTTAAR
ncbi:hypothetical protein [Pseudomonas moorei]|uniref:hypothetical protein n=1 Tax=Pseudomonas moorei TaxID=395599 RepID=UPI001FF6670A|nr:hypothetical protein [Pseudomonas moorei]